MLKDKPVGRKLHISIGIISRVNNHKKKSIEVDWANETTLEEECHNLYVLVKIPREKREQKFIIILSCVQ